MYTATICHSKRDYNLSVKALERGFVSLSNLIVIIWYQCIVSGSSWNQSLPWCYFTTNLAEIYFCHCYLRVASWALFISLLGECATFLIKKRKSTNPDVNIGLQRNEWSVWCLPLSILQSKCEDCSGGLPRCCLHSALATFAYTEQSDSFRHLSILSHLAMLHPSAKTKGFNIPWISIKNSTGCLLTGDSHATQTHLWQYYYIYVQI